MARSTSSLAQLCRQRLAQWSHRASRSGLSLPFDEAVRELTQITQTNFDNGRFQRFQRHMRQGRGLTPARYLDCVIEQWVAERERVGRLDARDRAAWTALHAQVLGWAQTMLRRAPVHSGASAEDFAQRACERLYLARYPYDVAFDAWTHTILIHLIQEETRHPDALDKPHDSLDEGRAPSGESVAAAPRRAQVSDPHAIDFDKLLANRDWLERALRQMRSADQVQVLRYTYYDELADAEIARRLGKRVATIHTLRHRALRRLAQILAKLDVSE